MRWPDRQSAPVATTINVSPLADICNRLSRAANHISHMSDTPASEFEAIPKPTFIPAVR